MPWNGRRSRQKQRRRKRRAAIGPCLPPLRRWWGGGRLTKDTEALLAFYDFPAEHWDHLRTSNPIESVFATVRHRTVRTKGALSQKTAKLMVFTLVRAASKTWRKLNGTNQLPRLIEGVKFTDGIAQTDANQDRAA